MAQGAYFLAEQADSNCSLLWKYLALQYYTYFSPYVQDLNVPHGKPASLHCRSRAKQAEATKLSRKPVTNE